MNLVYPVAKADHVVEVAKRPATMISPFFLPYFSGSVPAMATKVTQPTADPNMVKYSVMPFTVPEITALSKPKRNLPSATIKLMRIVYEWFILTTGCDCVMSDGWRWVEFKAMLVGRKGRVVRLGL